MNYFHGGPPGLKVGDFILPPCETGVKSCADYGARGACRTDRIYLTSDIVAAIMFGSLHPSKKGMVYEVQPADLVEHDPDCLEFGLSFQAQRAKIVRVIPITRKQRNKVLKAFGIIWK